MAVVVMSIINYVAHQYMHKHHTQYTTQKKTSPGDGLQSLIALFLVIPPPGGRERDIVIVWFVCLFVCLSVC